MLSKVCWRLAEFIETHWWIPITAGAIAVLFLIVDVIMRYM